MSITRFFIKSIRPITLSQTLHRLPQTSTKSYFAIKSTTPIAIRNWNIPSYVSGSSRFFSTGHSLENRYVDMTDNDKYLDISGIDKAALLANLYNNSRPVGLGFCDPKSMSEMSYEEAKEIIDSGKLSFDYFNGRVMKIDLDRAKLYVGSYDQNNGEGAALTAINACKNGQTIKSKKPIPANKMERLAAEGRITEAENEADKHITISFLNF